MNDGLRIFLMVASVIFTIAIVGISFYLIRNSQDAGEHVMDVMRKQEDAMHVDLLENELSYADMRFAYSFLFISSIYHIDYGIISSLLLGLP